MKRVVRWCWIWVCVFCRWFGRKNDYYWPGRRAWFKTAALVATCNARGCDGVVYGDPPLWMHVHRFKINTRINPYGTVTEQRCRCGAYRHTTAKDLNGINMGDRPKWHAGRHPANASGEVRNPAAERTA